MANILQPIDAIPWKKMLIILFIFYWNLYIEVRNMTVRRDRGNMGNGAGGSYGHISPSFDLMVVFESKSCLYPHHHDSLY